MRSNSCFTVVIELLAVLKLPSGPNRPLPYLLTLVPPLILSLLDPEIFFKALDFAGTYGGMKIYLFTYSMPFFYCNQAVRNNMNISEKMVYKVS